MPTNPAPQLSALELNRPAAGQEVVLAAPATGAQGASQLVLNFPPDSAMLERQGDNLVFTFEDGARVVVENFYQTYTKDTVPDFVADGTLVAGADFFSAFGETLMPAAGPAAAQAADGGGRYSESAAASLAGGIERLDGLDTEFSNQVETVQPLTATGVDPLTVAAADAADAGGAGTGTGLGTGIGTGIGTGTTPVTPPTIIPSVPDSTPEAPVISTPAPSGDTGGTTPAPTPTPSGDTGGTTPAPTPTPSGDTGGTDGSGDSGSSGGSGDSGSSGGSGDSGSSGGSGDSGSSGGSGDSGSSGGSGDSGSSGGSGDAVEVPNADPTGERIQVGGESAENMGKGAVGVTDTITIDNFGKLHGQTSEGGSTSNWEVGKSDFTLDKMADGRVGEHVVDNIDESILGTNLTVNEMYRGAIGGDLASGKDMTGKTGVVDSITLGDTGRGYVGGDAGKDMVGGAKGGEDTITVGTMDVGAPANSDAAINNAALGGDAGHDMKTGAVGGIDTIKVDTFISGLIGGDAGHNMNENAMGGEDTITITNMQGVNSEGKNTKLDGLNRVVAHDTNDTHNYSAVGGDAGYDMNNNAVGGDDTIKVTTMTSGMLAGDAGHSMYSNTVAGDDTITIDRMDGGFVGGDAGRQFFSSVLGGKDTIKITEMNGGYVGGESSQVMSANATGNTDYISVETMKGGQIYGDSGRLLTSNDQKSGATGGDDNITVSEMNGGTIYGDAKNMETGTTGGNDTIAVGTLHNGSIYGDAATMTGNSVGGDDHIMVKNLDVDAKQSVVIDGGKGDDTIVLGQVEGVEDVDGLNGHGQISVAESGSVSIWGGEGDDTLEFATDGEIVLTDTQITIGHTANNDSGTISYDSIEHFALDGSSFGKGGTLDAGAMAHDVNLHGSDYNDHLIGGAGNDTIIGGAGNDFIRGGEGADTFVWENGDLVGDDEILDFDAVQGDRIDFSGITTGNYALSINDEGGNSVISLVDEDGTSHDFNLKVNGVVTVDDITFGDHVNLLSKSPLVGELDDNKLEPATPETAIPDTNQPATEGSDPVTSDSGSHTTEHPDTPQPSVTPGPEPVAAPDAGVEQTVADLMQDIEIATQTEHGF